MEKYCNLTGSFIKHQYALHLLLGAVFCLLSVCFLSFRNLEAEQCAKAMEMYVCFIGIIFLAPLFMPEQDREIWNLEKTKEMPLWKIYFIRLLAGIAGIALVVSAFIGIMYLQGSSFSAGTLWLGSFTEAVFLGMIGFFVSAVTNQAVIGYMLAVIFYMINIGASKYLGKFALFQMSKGEYGFWPYMAAGAVCLAVLGILIRERKI